MRVGEGTRNWEGMILGPTRKDIAMSSWAIKDRPGFLHFSWMKM